MVKMKHLYSLIVTFSVVFVAFSQTNTEPNTVRTIENIYSLKPFDGPLANPHKGFCVPTGGAWSFIPEWEYGPGGSKNNQAWRVITHGTGYQRWNKLNPAKGVYDWTELDKLLDACEKHGVGYGLRVFPYSSSLGAKSNYTVEEDYDWTPSFVYAEGAQKDSAKLTYNGKQYTVVVPVWDDPVYLQAQKDFAKAMAEKYDGDPRLEYIDIRPFGNWGEWHASQLKGSEMPSEQIQMDMLTYYASVFQKTLLVLPSSGAGDVYKHALSLGITKRDDGLIATPDREYTLLPAYEANLPTIGENLAGYTTMLNFNDVIPGGYLKWTLERWKKVINVAHLTYYVLDQDSDAGYRFYNDNQAEVDSMTKVIGYNLRLTNAALTSVKDETATNHTLNITVQNTGVAPCFFDLYLVAEWVDRLGVVLEPLDSTVFIPKGTFKDGMNQKFEFNFSVPARQTNVADLPGVSLALSLYESEEAYLMGKNPTVRFDNDGLMEDNRLRLTSCTHEFGPWSIVKAPTTTEMGLRKRLCMREHCSSYEEETLPASTTTNLNEVGNARWSVSTYAVGKEIFVTQVKGKTVALYDSVGELYDQRMLEQDEMQWTVPQNGLYMVVVDGVSYKVVVK